MNKFYGLLKYKYMILLISGVFPPEPVVSASLAYDLALELSTITNVKVLTPKPSRPLGFSFLKESEKRKEFEHIILNSFTYPKSKIVGRMLESYSFGKHAANFIKKNHSDISCIYVNTWPLLSQWLIVKTSKKYSIPRVLHVQDIYPESLLDKLPVLKRLIIKLFLPIDKYVQRNASKVIVISQKMKSYLIDSRGLKENRINVIYNWQNEEKFIFQNSGKKGYKTSDFTFMFLGNINRTAAIDILISAFKISRIENSKLIIAGNGSEKDYLLSLTTNCQKNTIEFWDAPIMEVPEIQAKADVLLLNLRKGASMYALPSKLSAYMFSAKPIIACIDEDSDTANAIREADCGWIIPPENANALSAAMKAIVLTPEKTLKKLGVNGFKYAIENFSKRINLYKLVNIILETATM